MPDVHAIDPLDPNKRIAFHATANGIAMEHVIRTGQHNMRVKHFHPEYEIFYILEGTRQFFFGNRYFTASKGDLIIIDSNMIHMTKSDETDEGHNRIILYITPEALERLDSRYLQLNLKRFLHEHYGIYHLTKQQHEQFMDLYYLFKNEARSMRKYHVRAIELAVAQYLLHLHRDFEKVPASAVFYETDERFKHVYEIADYLSANLDRDISLEDLSERFFLSSYYICRVFKKVTGYNIKEFVNVHRVNRAKYLLETTDRSIALIAEEVGYRSVTHFERVFKDYMNMSPLKYRKTQNLYVSSIIPEMGEV